MASNIGNNSMVRLLVEHGAALDDADPVSNTIIFILYCFYLYFTAMSTYFLFYAL